MALFNKKMCNCGHEYKVSDAIEIINTGEIITEFKCAKCGVTINSRELAKILSEKINKLQLNEWFSINQLLSPDKIVEIPANKLFSMNNYHLLGYEDRLIRSIKYGDNYEIFYKKDNAHSWFNDKFLHKIALRQLFNPVCNKVEYSDGLSTLKTDLENIVRRVYESLPDGHIKGYSIDVGDPVYMKHDNKEYLKFQVIRSDFDGNSMHNDTCVIYSIEQDEIINDDSRLYQDIAVDEIDK